MLIAAGVLSVFIWAYLVLGRGGFWRIYATAPALPQQEDPANSNPVRIAVIIPARNEADVIGRAVRSLLQQRGGNDLHIFLVDDASQDGTAQAARAAAIAEERNQSLTIISGSPLPGGWSGKLWAMQQAIERASATAPDFFLFTDADIEHSPASISTLVSIAQTTGPYDMASFMVKLYCHSPAEKLLIPAFVYFFFKLYPPALIADPRRSEAGAAGGCILIRPAALANAGGIAAIRQEVIDDCSLAAKVKRTGGRLWLGASATTSSIRSYEGFSGIGRMISRSAFSQLRHSGLLLLLSVVGMTVTYLLPPALALIGHHRVPVILGAIAWLLMVLSYLPVLRLYRLNPFWALALPLAAVFYLGAMLHSAWKYWAGHGGEWKGRTQDPRLKIKDVSSKTEPAKPIKN